MASIDRDAAEHLAILLRKDPALLGVPLVDISGVSAWWAADQHRVCEQITRGGIDMARPPFSRMLMHYPARHMWRDGPLGTIVVYVRQVAKQFVQGTPAQLRFDVEVIIGGISTHILSGDLPLGGPYPVDGVPMSMSLRIPEEGYLRYGLTPEHMITNSNGGAGYFQPALMALILLNAKNVTLADQSQPRAMRHRATSNAASVVYKTLQIDAFRAQARRDTPAGGSEAVTALHLCRGSFATYTDDRKLFGKHAGTFWRPSHVKGTAAAGIVAKDYKLKEPK